MRELRDQGVGHYIMQCIFGSTAYEMCQSPTLHLHYKRPLIEAIAELRKENAELRKEHAERRKEIAELKAELGQQASRIERLEALVGQLVRSAKNRLSGASGVSEAHDVGEVK